MATATASSSKDKIGPPGPVNDRSHPLYKELSKLNREINHLTSHDIRQRLVTEKLSDLGSDSVIIKRYKQYRKRQLIQGAISNDLSCLPFELHNIIDTNQLGIHYLLILDFEATCESVNPSDYIHEIIEFPVVLLDVSSVQIVDRFHSYCQPFLNPKLSSFCTQLTGIEQCVVDEAPLFVEVFETFTQWMNKHELGTVYNFSIVTDCPWDIKNCLFPQCTLSKVQFPNYASKWIDVRKLFSTFYQISSGNLGNMLSLLGLQFEGREHSGMDDSLNITRVVSVLINDGCSLQYNRFISQDVINNFNK